MKRRCSGLLILIMVMVLVLSGCGESVAETTQKDSLTMIGLLVAESLNPYAGGLSDKIVDHSIFDSIVKFDETGKIVPCLAESWVDEADGKTVTFTLRQDVKFHDGSDLIADDVIFSLETLTAIPINSWMMSYIESWEKIDDYSFTMVKKTPYSKMMNIMAERLYIVPKALYEADLDAFSANPVGTGAYKYISQQEDKSVIMAANENYFMGAPEIKSVTVKPPLDASAAVIALESKEADIIFGVPTMQQSIISDNEDLVLVETAGWAMHMLVLMGENTADSNLRKAIKHAINPENAVLVANEGIGVPATELYAEKVMGDMVGAVPYEGYNLDMSMEFLAKSNYTEALELVISVDSSGAAMAQSIQSDLQKAGIKISIEQLDTNALYGKLMNSELDMAILPMGTHMNGIEEMLAVPIMPPFNAGMSPSEKRVELINAFMAESDAVAREAIVKEALALTIEESDMIPIFEPVFNLAHSKEITNVSPVSAATNVYYLGEVKAAQ